MYVRLVQDSLEQVAPSIKQKDDWRYHPTEDDFVWTTLQSLFYFNYLQGGPSGTGLNKSKL